jgi:hypothetical protein
MHEELFADYCKAIAEKFGIDGVHYDADRKSIVFSSTSEHGDCIPKALQGQSNTFFAFLVGALAFGTKHTVLQSSEDGTLLQIKGSEDYIVEHILEHRDLVLSKIDKLNCRSDAEATHRAFVEDYHSFRDKMRVPAAPEELSRSYRNLRDDRSRGDDTPKRGR